ncbi:uncharacterized protein SPPG_03345 [Spizellomyces punctatus DAOM BR117]|uniref:Uncharacterized protein n=1 Tax=Spizellomyces punctatus (strain DAOM BR117) TaxID=645134 RepID=A0A0L0HL35_SPIPD|nr:uncharacterized protein SPPG_03345 [Spizellomyces punctatus DAOM BR117]KND01544.1 hypothetical protein SPPG_03345 [Spizellomyces punctatus DAOM BR117]|eukprot:XP_016609583.1 hypothetical protein SPPG_03345 [Spizellomyces punctatus DAOM BR117]
MDQRAAFYLAGLSSALAVVLVVFAAVFLWKRRKGSILVSRTAQDKDKAPHRRSVPCESTIPLASRTGDKPAHRSASLSRPQPEQTGLRSGKSDPSTPKSFPASPSFRTILATRSCESLLQLPSPAVETWTLDILDAQPSRSDSTINVTTTPSLPRRVRQQPTQENLNDSGVPLESESLRDSLGQQFGTMITAPTSNGSK